MKRTQRNWWDGRAQAKQELLRQQLNATNKAMGMLGRFGFAAEERRRADAIARSRRVPLGRWAAHGGSVRKVKSWTPRSKWQPKAQPAMVAA